MQKLYQQPSDLDPEISFSHDEQIFRISGTSSPENVRATFEPAVNWLSEYRNKINTDKIIYTEDKPFLLQIDLEYFNSSSAIFLYDLVMIVKSMKDDDIPAIITWSYDPADSDSREAGEDLSILAEIEFEYIKRQ